MKKKHPFIHIIFFISLYLLASYHTQAADIFWITEDTDEDEIAAALAVPNSLCRDGTCRDIDDIVDKIPRAASNINFEFDSYKLTDRSKMLLRKMGRVLQGKLYDATLIIAGHTDSKGSDTYNLSLSIKRARQVQEFLMNEYYVPEKRLRIKAYGERKPIVTNQTEEGRAMNRRVEFIRVSP
jgi:outer membrane protein OmpA-like peptidoglycan-associated protein